MLKTILFDHDDLDGAGCRIVFQLAYHHMKNGEEYKIVHCSNNHVDKIVTDMINSDDVNEDTEIYFSDICASREVLEAVVAKFKTVRIFDHHRTNFFATWIVPNAVIVPENNLGVLESGTSLLFKYFAEIAANNPYDPRSLYFLDKNTLNKLIADSKKSGKNWKESIGLFITAIDHNNFGFFADLVENIRSYDTYDWKDKNNLTAKKLQTLFFLLGMDRFCHRYTERIIRRDNTDIISKTDLEFVDAKLESEKRVIESIGLDDIYDVSIKGLRAAFILSSAGANISEVSHQFLTNHPEFDMFIGFNFSRGGEYSFRCVRDDIDIGTDIALPIGGGGHPKASGAPIPIGIKNSIIDLLMSGIDDNYCANFQWNE